MAIEPSWMNPPQWMQTGQPQQMQQQPTTQQGWNLPTWNVQAPSYTPMQGYAPRSIGPQRDEAWSAPQWQTPSWMPTDGGTVDWWRNADNQQAMNAYQAMMSPQWQAQQNAYQYGRDADTADYRWGQQFDWTRQGDVFNQGLAARQQMTQEEAARVAADQWNRQFGHTQAIDQANLNLQGRELENTYALGLGNIDARRYETDVNRQIGLGNIDAQRYGTDVQRELGLGNIGARNRESDINLQLGQGNIDVQRQANDINRALGEGRLTLDQAANAWRQTLETNRLAQEAQLAREANAAQERMVTMQTWGRRQAPNARWMRNW